MIWSEDTRIEGGGREFYTYAVSRIYFFNGIKDIKDDAAAVPDVSAILVCPLIRCRTQELWNERKNLGMHFDSVKTGGLGIGGGSLIVQDRLMDFFQGKRLWRDGIFKALRGKGFCLRVDGGRAQRQVAIEIIRM